MYVKNFSRITIIGSGPAYLAQSPQLAKQACIAADMEKVYEIAPGKCISLSLRMTI